EAAQIESQAENGTETLLLDEVGAPTLELIRLDDIARIESRCLGAPDRRLRSDEHDMLEVRPGLRASGDAQAIQQPREHLLVPPTLLQRRRNAECRSTVGDAELAQLIDQKVAAVVLRLQQVEGESPIDDDVIDLRHLSIDRDSKVVKDNVILGVPKMCVEIVRGVPFALDAAR